MAKYRPLTVQEKQAIIADVVAGMKHAEVARKRGVHRVTVSRLMGEFREGSPDTMYANPEGDYKRRLVDKAIPAVEAGLDCKADPYKRANIGVDVLKGCGEFQGDNMVGIKVTLAMPASFQSTYVRTVPAESQATAERIPADGESESEKTGVPETTEKKGD